MLKIITSMQQLDIEKLLGVYNLSNQGKWGKNDMLDYLQEDFFRRRNTCLCVWETSEGYQSALRLEPYRDSLLITALETKPASRRKGYAQDLLNAVLEHLRHMQCTRLYSHVEKCNIPSLKLHQKCGFQIHSDTARYIDGTVTQNSYTLCREL